MGIVTAPIRSDEGTEIGALEVRTLSGRGDRLEIDGERVVVEEEGTYVFAILRRSHDGPVVIQPGKELFSFDDDSRTRGRLHPGQHVGRIRLLIQDESHEGSVMLSVQPKKLDEETEYRQMLDDVAGVATEAILQGFAPAAVALEHEPATRPKLLYQQFAFLHARLMGAGETDLALVLHRPHRAWLDREEQRLPGMAMRGSSRTIRGLTRPGPRVRGGPESIMDSLPRRLAVARSEETLDTEANRFVRFALERWRRIAREVLDVLGSQSSQSGPISRGVDAAEDVIKLVDRTLSALMFREVGRLGSFPTGNQVLQKRAGYRELFRTFVLTETGARLALDWELEDVFGASQRNIATLYEYWAFIQLAASVGVVCGQDQTIKALKLSTDGMSMAFRRGAESGLRWSTAARGRALEIELFFNRDFLVSAQPDASWTRAMRPDCSIRVRPEGLGHGASPDDLAIWLHFDAKYRVEYSERQFSRPPEDDDALAAEAEATERVGRSKREDLLKMHAYRDAIRRSAGAYVLYPGQHHQQPFMEHHELLPGLGAFVLRPTARDTAGAAQLESFLLDVLDHVADRATQHERSRYWRTVIHRTSPPQSQDRRLPALDRPPSDAPVLCGYVRGRAHHQWIEKHGLYNLRAGDRRGSVGADAEMLRPTDLILYGPDLRPTLWERMGAWFVQSQSEMLRLEYPNPHGRVYMCCPLERRGDEPEWLALLALGVGSLQGSPPGAPFSTTWQLLLESAR